MLLYYHTYVLQIIFSSSGINIAKKKVSLLDDYLLFNIGFFY
jgi:hypothetical protein